MELISYLSEASSDHSDDAKVQHSSLKAHPEGVELSLIKKALLEGVELSSLKNVLIEGDKHITDVNGEKYVVMEDWMKIEPCLPHLVGGERLVGVVTCMTCLFFYSKSSCDPFLFFLVSSRPNSFTIERLLHY